jgi:hypothetical protein
MGSLRDLSRYGNCKLSMWTSFLVLDSLLTKADCLIPPPLCVYSAWYRIYFYICSGLIIEALYDLCALNSPLVVERAIGV